MTDQIAASVHRALEPLKVYAEEVTVRGTGPSRKLIVVIDSDAGIGIEDISRASRAIAAVLDEDDVMGESPYLLEATSRGVDRPLTLPRHWRRAIGRVVAVTLSDGERFEARVNDLNESSVSLSVRGVVTEYPLDDIDKAVVQIELNRKDI